MAGPQAPPHSLAERFPALEAITDLPVRELLAAAHAVQVPSGTALFRDGGPCEAYLLVLEGTVRVQKIAVNGREIVLYRVGPGETCILTTSCLLARRDYPATGVAETDVRGVAIPAGVFRNALAMSDRFREFVFAEYGRRIADLIVLVEEVAFGRLDVRLAQRLLAHYTGPEPSVRTTHQDLAAELGTAREVVSRQLKEFERRGWVGLHRGRIELIDRPSLQGLAAQGVV
ncbi:MAG: Crp/Fnr family transcriptional regulator [Gammaproteobacteria bacterium]